MGAARWCPAHCRLNTNRRSQVFLKIKDGGLGFGSASLRREAAYIGACGGGMKPLLHKLSADTRGEGSAVSTLQALRRIWPQWGLQMDDLETARRRNKGAGAK